MSYNERVFFQYLPNHNVTVVSIPDYSVEGPSSYKHKNRLSVNRENPWIYSTVIRGKHTPTPQDFRSWVKDRNKLKEWSDARGGEIGTNTAEQYDILANVKHMFKMNSKL